MRFHTIITFSVPIRFHSSQVRRGPPDLTPQQTGSSRTVKRYPSSAGPITSNALPNGNGYSTGHGAAAAAAAQGNWPGTGRAGNTDRHSPSIPRTGAAAAAAAANGQPQKPQLSNALSHAGKYKQTASKQQGGLAGLT